MNAEGRLLATVSSRSWRALVVPAVLSLFVAACDPPRSPGADGGAAGAAADGSGGAAASAGALEPGRAALPELSELAGAHYAGEPNDRDHLATFPAAPGRLHARIDAPSDVDAYLLPASLFASPVSLELHPRGDARLRARLFDGSGELVLTRSAGRPGRPIGVPALGPAPQGGAWELVVDAPGATGGHEEYAVSLHHSALAALAAEREPNDSTALAMALPSAPLVGFIDDVDDEDSFRFDAAGGQRLALEVSPGPEVDAVVVLSCGSEAPRTFDAAGPGGVEAICGEALPAGACTVTIGARALGADGDGVGRYDLTADLVEGIADVEPNPQSAPTIDGVGRGFLASASDEDAFAWRVIAPIDAEAEQTIEVEPPPGVDIVFELLDEQGGLIRRQDAGRAGVTERLEASLPSGRYRIVVRAASGQSCTAPYEIRIEG